MGWVLFEARNHFQPPDFNLQPSTLPLPTYFPPPLPPPPPALPQPAATLDSRISPSVLLIIAILAIIFFLSGLLHLLVRYLLRPTAREPDDADDVTALQGQLQQLFHLHDAGVDQSFIDALPVFLYKSITGVKDPFDCAVCLCEFEADDSLRLLPKCSHAFHIECIDTWLLSHSTCPLCRSSLLLPDFSAPSHGCTTPLLLVLQSGGESFRESSTTATADNYLPNSQEDPAAKDQEPAAPPLPPALVAAPAVTTSAEGSKVVPVKLGKFRNLEANSHGGGGEGTSSTTVTVGVSTNDNGKLDGRRCFSMGSFEYVMDETSHLQVAIKPPVLKKPGGSAKKPRRRLAMSECDCHSQREGFKGFEPPPAGSRGSEPRKAESFSFSKTWLRTRKEIKSSSSSPAAAQLGHQPDTGSSRRTFSFRLPQLSGGRGAAVQEEEEEEVDQLEEASKGKCESSRQHRAAACSEFDSESEFGVDLEVGSCQNHGGGRALTRGEETPSFARRTFLWVLGGGRQHHNHKVGSHPHLSS